MKNSNKVEIVFSLWEAGVHPDKISAQLNIHRATTSRWIKDSQHLGLNRTLIRLRIYEWLRFFNGTFRSF